MTHEVTRREALSQVSTYVALGTLFDNIAEGQETFDKTRDRLTTAEQDIARLEERLAGL